MLIFRYIVLLCFGLIVTLISLLFTDNICQATMLIMAESIHETTCHGRVGYLPWNSKFAIMNGTHAFTIISANVF